MSAFVTAVALFLLLNLVAGMYRVVRGPALADRMLASQLFGTTGVAILLLLSVAAGRPEIVDAALVFALLAVVNVTVFTRRRSSGGNP